MNAKFQTLVEHLYVVGGMLERLPHNQTAVPVPQDNHRRLGALFVLAEAQGPLTNSDLIEKRLTTLVRDTFYGSHGGITAGLRRAMDTANQWLFQYNTTKDAPKKIAAGVVAVALHGEDLFIAQAGPAAVFTRFSGFVTRYPENSTWLEPVKNPLIGPSPALGLQYAIDPFISHLQVAHNDLITLVDGRLAKNLPKDRASTLLASGDVQAIAQKLVKGTQLQHGSAMVIQTKDAQGEPAASPQKKSFAPAGHSGRKKGGFNFAVPTSVSATQSRTPAGAATLRRKQFPISLPALPSLPSLPDIPFADIFNTVAHGIMTALTMLGEGLQTLLRLAAPGEPANDGTNQRYASRHGLKIVAISLPVLVIAIAVGRYLYQDYNLNQNYTTTIQQANEKLATAMEARPEQARTLLNDAAILSQQASAIKVEHPEVADLTAKITARQDIINNVKYIYHLMALDTFGESAQPQQVVQAGLQMFVFDPVTQAVFANTLGDLGDQFTTESVPIIQQGQQIQGITTGAILGMIWIPAAGNHTRDSLVIVARNGIFEYDPRFSAVEKSTIYSVDQWVTPVAFGSFYGNFYVLDSGANQIYRYLPTDEGYSAKPDNYFAEDKQINLAGAVDLAIDESIYVLYQDGRIAKFLSGDPAPFELTGLDVPFKNPTSIFTMPDTVNYLYVADAGNQRIVKLTKDGVFLAQFKPKNNDNIIFDNLHGLTVDEQNGKVYALNGNTLYAFNLVDE